MAIGQRATGIMDFFGDAVNEFQRRQQVAPPTTQVLTPPMASPVDQPPASPLQRAMGVPQTVISSTGQTMATDYPDGRLAMASTTPQVQQQFRGMPQSGMPTPPRVITVDQRPDLNQGAQQSQLGQGQFTPEMLRTGQQTPDVMGMEKLASDADKVVREIQRNPQLEQDPSFMDQVKSYFGNRENMVRLALAFNSMRLTPDTGLAAALGSELEGIQEQQVTQEELRRERAVRNQTAEYFKAQGRPDLASLIEMGAIDGKQAFELGKDKEGQVVTAQQLREQFPGEDIQDGLYNIKPNGNITKVGGGGVNVSVGGPAAIQPGLEQAGKTIFEQDIEGANQASTALRNIAKTDEVLRLLDEGEPVTGLIAPIQDVVNNARAMLGDEEAIRQASDTGLLNALLGQEVFGSITALGIGARGLDTPAEREFLREVMAGTISMNEETIRKIAELRRKYATEVIRSYNDKVRAGDYDLLNQNFNNRYQAIDIPEKPQLQIPPVPPAFQGNADDWPEIYRNMDPQDRALFAN